MPHTNTMLATGFVVDTPEEGTIFPSAGGTSADPQVQAVYWRCLVVLFASARFSNPDQRLALFTNIDPPIVDGERISDVLMRYGVEIHRVPLTARLPAGTTRNWGNVLYYHDIMEHLSATETADLRVAIVDCDIVVTRPLGPLFSLLDDHDIAGYVVEQTEPDEDVNGLTLRQIDGKARALGVTGDDFTLHYGGELFLTSIGAWQKHHALFTRLLEEAISGTGVGGGIVTEEHVFSIVAALLRGQVARGNHLIKRIWTSPRYNSVAPGDEALMLWHLPAEKRYGIRDIFAMLRRSGFPRAMDVCTFHAMAMKLCGVPHKGLFKIAHDGVRQVAAKAGFYK